MRAATARATAGQRHHYATRLAAGDYHQQKEDI